jgi:hypothetical protein
MGACTKPPDLAVVLEAIYTKTRHGPRGRSLHFILHKTAQNITWLQVRQSAGVSGRAIVSFPHNHREKALVFLLSVPHVTRR